MKFKRIISSLAIAVLTYSAIGAENPAVIPLPANLEQGSGEFRFTSPATTVAIPQWEGDSIANLFRVIEPELKQAAGVSFITTSPGKQADITILTNPRLGPEAYTLDAGQNGITIEASHPAGFFYALQTLRQLLPAASATPAAIPATAITDEPRFGWRGFMLDEGRHIFGPDEVKKIIDLMASYKLNRFHWHLTEDQGWRVEIKKYPLLTEVGAFRNSTTLGWRKAAPDTVSYGGYYTQQQIRDIVDYARDRFIEIVPEIDIPGHTQAAVAAYPDILACDPENPHSVWLMQGVSHDVMNVANPKAVEMTKDILDEIIDLFPYPYLHLGGDECPTEKWQANDECRQLLARIGSENYRDLQLNFYKELADHIATKPSDKQRRLIFWNEAQHGNTDMLPDDIVIMSWVDADNEARRAASNGFNTILTPQIPYYINRKQSEAAGEPLSQGMGKETVEAVYAYDPLAQVPDSIADKYMGVQANFWSEYVVNPVFLEYLMMPRLAAVAEAAWTPQSRRDFSDFRQRIDAQRPLLDRKGWYYAGHIFGPDSESTTVIDTK